jgi:signal transduction histidine kinase/ActR/RegA family two-component response regulator
MFYKQRTTIRRWREKMRYLPVIIVAGAGIILSGITFKVMRNDEDNKIQLDLKRCAENRMMALQRGLEAGYLVLESMSAFHDSAAAMSRQDFKRLVRPLLKNNIAVQALEWIPRVALAQRPAYEAAARADGYERFGITQRESQGRMISAEEREEYFPVYYVEPYRGNEIALGFDLASNAIRKQALETARNSGQMTATARITLVQETEKQFGFLIFIPIYHGESSSLDRTDRRARLQGFMLGVFRIGDLVQKAFSYLDPQGIDVVLEDMSAPEDERFLYYHPYRGDAQPISDPALHPHQRPARFSHTNVIDVAGRRWRLTCIAAPDFVAARRCWLPLALLVITILCSALAAAYLFSTIRSKNRYRQAMGLLQNKIDTCDQVEKALDESQNRLRQAQKMEAIGTLAGGIAHDFNNILAAITGFCELAMARNGNESARQSDLRQILKAADRATALVRQILTFSRQHKEEPKPIQIAPIIKEVAKLLKATLSADIELHTDIRNYQDPILADPISIHQVIMNLCTNAAHAMKETGGRLELALGPADPETIAAFGLADPSDSMWLNLRVSDTGHGMTPEIMESIFDPYFTTKAPGEGTGLGLSVVHGIVKKCGGDIRVQSQKGKGTTFDVFWPQIIIEPPPQPVRAGRLTGGNESILIVDDEPDLTTITQRKLVQLGYRVTTRTSSIEAGELFKTRPDDFDLVVTDMNMPHMNGLKLAGLMMSIRPGIPVILYTGFSSQVSEEKVKAIGIKALVMKPVSWHDLAATVRKVLDGHELYKPIFEGDR